MKNTNELLDKIRKGKKGDSSFLRDKDFECPKIQYFLADILREHEMSKAEYMAKMNLDCSYGYQMLNGLRKPTRELLLRTAILFHFNLEETQRLLKIGNREVLYPRIRKDAIAIFALEKGLSLTEYWELLESYEEGI